MPNFKSPLGNKQFSGQPMREFDVPDETDDEQPAMRQRGPSMHGSQQPTDVNAAMAFSNRLEHDNMENEVEMERQIKSAKDDRRRGIDRLNDGAKRRIEMLVGMTRGTREVDLDGNIFILQTLKSRDMRSALTAAAEFDGTIGSPFEIRRQLLARSLVQIAGIEAAQFVGSNDIEAKLQFVDEQIESVLNRLYNEYLIMVNESTEKYAIKSQPDAAEVVEDLKK